MLGLDAFGTFHTLISLIAVFSGAFALIRDKYISWDNGVGKVYVIATAITCVTGFFIFHHGGIGKAHVLGIITLIVLGIALASGKDTRLFGRFSPYVETVAYSMTFFFHLIPGITETSTRLPLSTPLASTPNDSHIQTAIGICFVLFVVGAVLQVVALRAKLNRYP